MDKLLMLLEEDARLTPAQLAVMLNTTEEAVREAIRKYAREGVILAYKTLIDWDRTEREYVTALIEIKVTPHIGKGFDKVAKRICQYPEVRDLYLMSGGFDLAAMIEGRSLRDVALFVAEKLAVLEDVTSTATHFVLRKYKDKGVEYRVEEKDERSQAGV